MPRFGSVAARGRRDPEAGETGAARGLRRRRDPGVARRWGAAGASARIGAMQHRIAELASPLGPLAAEFTSTGALARLDFLDGTLEEHLSERRAAGAEVARDDAVASELARQLAEYFGGARTRFEVPLALEGTDFQREVWSALLAIPHGAVVTYGELAERLGRPGASRAVGSANGANPVPVLVPCHRVVAAGGGLGGYSAGLERKQRLLELEGVLLPSGD